MDIKTSFDIFATWMRARFGETERGASLVEYALLVALIAVLCIGALKFLSGKTQAAFSSAGSSIS
jgi:pilus assembly protein Flp/PilA